MQMLRLVVGLMLQELQLLLLMLGLLVLLVLLLLLLLLMRHLLLVRHLLLHILFLLLHVRMVVLLQLRVPELRSGLRVVPLPWRCRLRPWRKKERGIEMTQRFWRRRAGAIWMPPGRQRVATYIGGTIIGLH